MAGEIEQLLDPILTLFDDVVKTRVSGHLVTAYLQGSRQTVAWARATKLGGITIQPFEGPPIQEAIDYAEKRCATLVKGMDQESRDRIAKVISDGIENKRGIPGLQADIRKEFRDMSTRRAQTIARTETCDALEQSFLTRAGAMGVTGKQWMPTDPCDLCAANADVGAIPIGEDFPSGDDAPPAHPSCLLPDNRVIAPLLVAGSRAFYSGKAIELTTEDGDRLTVTPNHMILTPFGFMKAKFLREGDYVISCLDSQGVASCIDPYNDHAPTPIEDVWNSLVMQESMVLTRVPTTPIDFYGDARGFDGEVDIVYSDSLLGRCVETLSLEHISEDGFNSRNPRSLGLSGYGSLFSLSDGWMPSFGSDVRSGCHSLALLDGHLSESDDIRLTAIAGRDTSIQEPFADSISAYAKYLGQAQFRFTGQIPSDNLRGIDGAVEPILAGDTIMGQDAVERGFAYPKLANQFIGRFSSLIAPKQIIKVGNFKFSGHVYDLQSLESLYITNGVVVKNCRCSLAPVMLEER